MSRNGIIPIKPRFAMIKRRAYEVLVNIGAAVLPIDPFKVGDYFPNIHIASYSELKCDKNPDPFFFDERNRRNAFLEFFSPAAAKGNIDGETHIFRSTNEYCVIYDDRVGSQNRIRWTIAHELGHIFLGHLVHFNQTALCRGGDGCERGGLTDEEYGVLEVEAHFFAAMFLAPENVLRKISVCNGNDELYAIMGLCEISEDAAIRRLKELKRISVSSYPIDLDIHRNFFLYIKSINYPDIAPLPKTELSSLPERYEDYAEYEHWDFVVFAIGEKERNGELFMALQGSTVLNDVGEILIII